MRGSMREKRPGVWELRVSLGRDRDGAYRQISRTVSGTRVEADTALARLVTEAQDGRFARTADTFEHLLDSWLDRRGDDLSPTTLQRYRGLIERHIRPALGATRLRKLDMDHLEDFYARLRRAGLAPATIRQAHAIIHRALREGIRRRWIATNPAANVEPIRMRRPEVRPPSVDEVHRLVALADTHDPPFATMLRLAAATGARRGELAGLRWSRVQLDEAAATIARAVIQVDNRLIEKDTKTHAIRRNSLDADMIAALRAHLDAMQARATKLGLELASDAFVFSREPECDSPWPPNDISEEFRYLCRRLGLEGLRFHDLRHFHATKLAEMGVPIRTIADRLGHAQASTTLNMYSHALPAIDRKAADVIGEVMRIEDV